MNSDVQALPHPRDRMSPVVVELAAIEEQMEALGSAVAEGAPAWLGAEWDAIEQRGALLANAGWPEAESRALLVDARRTLARALAWANGATAAGPKLATGPTTTRPPRRRWIAAAAAVAVGIATAIGIAVAARRPAA